MSAAAVRSIRAAARALWVVRRDYGEDALERTLEQLSPEDQAVIASNGNWYLSAREAQLRPANCQPYWLLQWGRGAGKTHAAANDTLDHMEEWGADFEGALISKTITDVRKTMIRGSSGLLEAAKARGYELHYVAGDKCVYHPNGAILHVLSAEENEPGRGPNLNFFWADEVAAWGHDALTTFKVFEMSLRIPAPGGGPAKAVITTTPKPNAITRFLLKRKDITITRQHTLDNKCIDPTRLIAEYGNTRLGKQELDGQLLDENNLLTPELIDKFRVVGTPDLDRTVVAVDPSIDEKDDSDACGIVAVARDLQVPPHAYVLEDATIQGASWGVWSRRAVDLAIAVRATKILVETNQGGNGVVEALQGALEDARQEHGHWIEIEICGVWHEKSKRARAEPCANRAENGRVHFVNHCPQLEDELCTWVEGAKSPNAMDAWAMAVTHLLFADEENLPWYQ